MSRARPLADRIVRRAIGVTLIVLFLVGAGTAAWLDWRAHVSLDAALLAAAEAHTTPHEETSSFDQDGVERAYPVAFLQPGHPAERWRAEVTGHAEPIIRIHDGVRFLLVDAHARYGVDLPDPIVVAWAHDVRLRDSIGGFVLAYSLFAFLAAFLAFVALKNLLGSAVAPIEQAAGDVKRVIGLGHGQRVDVQGPTEVQALLHAINDLLDRADHAYEAQARFTSEAAHELRTPLAALRGEIEVVLRRERTASHYRETLEHLHTHAQALTELVSALLMRARLDTGQLDGQTQYERLSEVLSRAMHDTSALLKQCGVGIKLRLRADPEVPIISPLLQSAIANLLRNVANHAAGADCQITIDADETHAWIDVHDEGPGIAQALAPDVFLHFHTSHPGETHGLGLGLPLAREIARHHHGDCVQIASSKGAHMRLSVAR